MNIFTIGASAGGVEALSYLVSQLPGDLPASLFVVVHFPERSTSVLPQILSRRTKLAVKHATDGEPIERGRVYVATPGCHMLVKNGFVRLVEGPRENASRPAIDPLFRSAARTYRSDVVGVILSGLLDDGTMGMASIRRYGGVVIAQDPEEALFGDMPRSVVVNVGADFVLPLSGIGAKIIELAHRPDPEAGSEPGIDPTEMDMDELHQLESRGKPSEYTCPECSGTLYELAEDGMFHFRCRVGHAYSLETLNAEQQVKIEAAMWTALRAIEENIATRQRLLTRAQMRGWDVIARTYEEQIVDEERHAETLRNFIEGRLK